MGIQSSDETKARVLEAFDTPFNKRNYAKAAEFWSEGYIQDPAMLRAGDKTLISRWCEPAGVGGTHGLRTRGDPFIRIGVHTCSHC